MSGIHKRAIGWIALAFVFCIALRILLYGVDYADGVNELSCSLVAVIWAMSVRKRVTDPALRHLLLGIAHGLILYLCLQFCRYDLFRAPLRLSRHLWYAFYLPMDVLPVLVLALSLRIYRPADKPLGWPFWLIALLFALLTVGVLTNDRHFWFKSFPGGVLDDDGTEKSGWLYYVLSALTYGTYLVSFWILLRKSRRFGGLRLRWLPLVPLGFGILYFLLYPLGIGIRILGFRILTMGQMLTLCVVGALECCIQIGLIPANSDYETLFSLSKQPAAILDGAGRPIYTTGSGYPFPDTPDEQILRHPIPGGSVEWAVDTAPLLRLNRELDEAVKAIETRNTYLAEQARIRAERTELETRNRIYDDIVSAVQPQLDHITALLDDRETPFAARLRQISLRSVFIKRRSNMELTAENGRLSATELQLAIAETVTYLRLSEVEAAVFAEGGGSYPAALITAAYTQLQRMIEACGSSLSKLLVFLKAEPGLLTLRLLLQAEDLELAAPFSAAGQPGFTQHVTVTKRDPDLLLVFRFQEGGAEE